MIINIYTHNGIKYQGIEAKDENRKDCLLLPTYTDMEDIVETTDETIMVKDLVNRENAHLCNIGLDAEQNKYVIMLNKVYDELCVYAQILYIDDTWELVDVIDTRFN